MDESLKTFQAEVATNSKRIDDTEGAIKELNNTQNNMLNRISTEIDEREKRKNNIAVFGLPELQSTVFEERKNFDKRLIEQLSAEIIPLKSYNETVLTMYRMGKRNPETLKRPLIVVLKSKETKAAIFKQASNLKGKERFKGISTCQDKTKLQIQCEKENDKNALTLCQQKNRTKERADYEVGYRYVANGPRGKKFCKKEKFNLQDLTIGDTTIDQTFRGFDLDELAMV